MMRINKQWAQSVDIHGGAISLLRKWRYSLSLNIPRLDAETISLGSEFQRQAAERRKEFR